MKHRAELKEDEIAILPGTALCKEAPHLKTYNVADGCRLENGNWHWFHASLGMFPREKVPSDCDVTT